MTILNVGEYVKLLMQQLYNKSSSLVKYFAYKYKRKRESEKFGNFSYYFISSFCLYQKGNKDIKYIHCL